MRKKAVEINADQDTEVKVKKKPGRRAMTPEEKEAVMKQRAAEKEMAALMKPELILQYQGDDTDIMALVEAAKADFHTAKKRTLVTSLNLYIKPEEKAAYYVINESFNGKVPF